MRRSFALLAPLALAVSVALSGCGPASDTIDPVAKAAADTTNTHGVRLAMSMTVTSSALPRAIHVTGSGVTDLRGRRGQVDLDMSDLAHVAGSGLDASKLHMTEIIDGTTAYMRTPLLDGKLPGHRKWIKIDLGKFTSAIGLNINQLAQPGQDPTQQLGLLRTVAGAKKVGTDTIRGVDTTHYRGTTRLDNYAKLVPKSQRAATRAAIQKLAKLSGTSSIPVDAWVDRKGLLRRIVMKIDLKPADLPQGMTMNVQEDLYDFGAKVEVQPPAEKDVYDATGALSGALKSSGLGG